MDMGGGGSCSLKYPICPKQVQNGQKRPQMSKKSLDKNA